MEVLSITYKDKELTFSGPSTWNELEPTAYLASLRFLWNYSNQLHYGLVLLSTIYKIPLMVMNSLNEEEAAIELERLKFLLENNLDKWILKKLSPHSYKKRWLLPSILKSYYGPDDKLSNLTFGEFMHAENYFSKYDLTKNDQYLNGLIAVLYRSKASKKQLLLTGDNRTEFNPNDIARRSKKLSKLELDVKHAILHNYSSIRLYLASVFTHVFETSDAENKEEQKPSTGTWLDVGISLARKEHALGNFKDLEKTNMYLVLKVLDSVIKEHREQEAYLARIKNNG